MQGLLYAGGIMMHLNRFLRLKPNFLYPRIVIKMARRIFNRLVEISRKEMEGLHLFDIKEGNPPVNLALWICIPGVSMNRVINIDFIRSIMMGIATDTDNIK